MEVLSALLVSIVLATLVSALYLSFFHHSDTKFQISDVIKPCIACAAINGLVMYAITSYLLT